jgi:dolichol-phosphate mannosyltransferase
MDKLLMATMLSVVIPTRNEEENAPSLITQLAGVLHDTASEVIFVDDSDDGTPEAIEMGAKKAGLAVTVVHRKGAERRGGLSTAVVEGIRAATGEYVLIMDADLQHPTAMIPLLLAKAEETGADIVIASRNVPGGSDAGLASPSRRVISWGARWMVKVLFFRTLRRVTDPLSGYFIARRDVLVDASLRPIGFKILLDVLVRADHSKVEELPLRFAPRAGGASKATMGQGREFLAHVATLFWARWTDSDVRRRRGVIRRRQRRKA